MSGDELPDHLSDGPRIEDADFVFDGFTQAEVTAIHDAVLSLTDELSSDPGRESYFVLGNYDDDKKARLVQASELIEYFDGQAIAVLLSDIDPENDDWDNFYVKFRYTVSFVDHVVLVAEDNDGGHELELGEVPLPMTYVLKRDYNNASIDRDLDYEKFDAMIAKLCAVMDRNGHCFEWRDMHSFARGVQTVVDVANTGDSNAIRASSAPEYSAASDPTSAAKVEPSLPPGWEIRNRTTDITLPNGETYPLSKLPEEIPDFSEMDTTDIESELPDVFRPPRSRDPEERDRRILDHLLSRHDDAPTWISYEWTIHSDARLILNVYRSGGGDSGEFRLEVSANLPARKVATPLDQADEIGALDDQAHDFMQRCHRNAEHYDGPEAIFDATLDDFESEGS